MISISIVSHEQNALVNRLLASLAACESLSECEILITEDVRDSVEIDEEAVGAPIKRIVNRSSQGFARNQNQAFQHASGDYFCILNPDVCWVEPLFLTLLEKIAAGFCDIVAPLAVDSMGQPQDSFRDMPSPGTLFLRRILRQRDQPTQFERGDLVYPDWIAGTFMLLTADVFRELGGFDDRFRMYFEDVDFCSRATLAGYKIGVDTNVRIFHEGRHQSRGINKFLLWHLQSSFRFFRSPVYRDIRHFMEQGETRETTRKPIGEVSTSIQKENIKIILSANTDWYLNNFRLPLINQLQSLGAEFVLVSPPGPLFVKLRFWVRVICRTMNNGIIKL
ncbi:MAG: glycosyltransferase [Anaerolineales bacterium]